MVFLRSVCPGDTSDIDRYDPIRLDLSRLVGSTYTNILVGTPAALRVARSSPVLNLLRINQTKRLVSARISSSDSLSATLVVFHST
ncbi:hypothetical protein RRG08_053939 [Elysia crispata]|uniref:Uncharacterized protein n=1 Tax=Elysia crispata TaxID=231223 RepID=A0AAE0ZEE1_9GAST|nr:hypothetical protein RRG08_053939 [Elysia crispata]